MMLGGSAQSGSAPVEVMQRLVGVMVWFKVQHYFHQNSLCNLAQRLLKPFRNTCLDKGNTCVSSLI